MRKKSALREWIEVIITAGILYLIIRTFIIQAFNIPSSSMEPTLKIRDRLFASKFSYGLSLPLTDKKVFQIRDPKRGEIIVFKYPEDPRKAFIKRVIALPGETIEIRQGKVYINDRLLNESYAYHIRKNLSYDNYGPVKVPPDFYFVMGDNRDRSSDSRIWGFLERKYILGKALFIYWPLNRVRVIK